MDPRLLDRLAADAWPPLERRDLDGWQLRASAGVTQRANSVLTSGPVGDVEAAIATAEAFAREHAIAPLFQLGPASLPAELPLRLTERGYAPHSRTLVLTGSVAEALAGLEEAEADVLLSDAPDEEWLQLWWSVDGRGESAERDVAQRILERCDSSYARLDDDRGAAACGRLAFATALDGRAWCGLFALAVRADARRRGHASAVIRSLLEEAARRGVDRLWIQVLEQNHGARRLYAELGCVESSWYEYWREG